MPGRSKLDRPLLGALILMGMNAIGAVKQQFDAASVQSQLADIRERVARIEAKMETPDRRLGYVEAPEEEQEE